LELASSEGKKKVIDTSVKVIKINQNYIYLQEKKNEASFS